MTAFGSRLKTSGTEVERRLPGVPAARREAGTEVNHRVDGNLFLPERIDDPEHLRVVFERAVRLHVAQRPFRRHHRGPGDRREILHRHDRIARVEDEHVVETWDDGVDRRQALAQRLLLVALVLRYLIGGRGLPRREGAAVLVLQIDLDPWRRHEQSPPGGAEEHRHRVARAIHVRLPARFHRVELAAAIELRRILAPRPALARPWSAFTHAEDGMFVELERQVPLLLERKLLDDLAAGVLHRHRQRIRPNLHRKSVDGPLHRLRKFANTDRRRRVRPIEYRWRGGKVLFERQRFQRHAKGPVAGGANVELRRLARRGDLRRRGLGGGRAAEQHGEDDQRSSECPSHWCAGNHMSVGRPRVSCSGITALSGTSTTKPEVSAFQPVLESSSESAPDRSLFPDETPS